MRQNFPCFDVDHCDLVLVLQIDVDLTGAVGGKKLGFAAQLTREMLKGFGYAVLDSGRPFEAIRIAERHEGPISLLITDIVMPEANGRALAEKLTAVRPEMKVLYTSGYEDDACVEQGELEAGCPLLEKPFTRGTLAKRIRELLDPTMS